MATLNSPYMRVEEQAKPHKGKKYYQVLNQKSGAILALVFWYPSWRRYCWTQYTDGIVWSGDCSAAMGQFCEDLTAEAKG